MKKTLVAIAALTLVGAASAQVTLSGGVRAAFQNSGVAGADTKLDANDVSVNNITITAVEDLGGGMKATGQYHMRNDIMTGEVSASRPATATNQLWRNSSVWVDGSWGQVRAGRWGLSGLYGFDAFGATGTVTAYAGNGIGARFTNMVQYQTPTISGLSAQIGVSMDGAAANEDGSWIYINYAAGPLALRLISEKSAALTLAALPAYGLQPATTASVAVDAQTTGLGVGGSYDFGPAKVMGGYASSKGTASGAVIGEQYHVGVTAPMGAILGKAGYMKNQTSGADTFAVGVDYSLSKTALLFADIGKTSTNANATWQVGVQKNF